MGRLLQPFILTLSALLAASYTYVAWSLSATGWQLPALGIPFLMIWIVPAVYWGGGRERHGMLDEWGRQASYLCMGWVSFLLVLTLARDLLLLLPRWSQDLSAAHAALNDFGAPLVYGGALLALAIGMLAALRGPPVRLGTQPELTLIRLRRA